MYSRIHLCCTRFLCSFTVRVELPKVLHHARRSQDDSKRMHTPARSQREHTVQEIANRKVTEQNNASTLNFDHQCDRAERCTLSAVRMKLHPGMAHCKAIHAPELSECRQGWRWCLSSKRGIAALSNYSKGESAKVLRRSAPGAPTASPR